jgi:hypothetical protein
MSADVILLKLLFYCGQATNGLSMSLKVCSIKCIFFSQHLDSNLQLSFSRNTTLGKLTSLSLNFSPIWKFTIGSTLQGYKD